MLFAAIFLHMELWRKVFKVYFAQSGRIVRILVNILFIYYGCCAMAIIQI